MSVVTRVFLVGSAALALVGCKQEEPPPPPVDTAPEFLTLDIPVDARVDGDPFSCAQEFQALGSTAAVARFGDFRMYLSNIGLTTADGNTTFIDLTPSAFQGNGLVLLDFEDGTRNCEGGTAETHMSIQGTVPNDAEYTNLTFTVGVPFENNHVMSATGQPAPLDVESMWRSPLFGYYFLKIDMTTVGEPEGYPLHVTSSGCSIGGGGQVESCTSPNRREWLFRNFDARSNKLVIDVARLAARNDLNNNTTTPPPNPVDTPPGCQSDNNDPDCQDFFISYGLSAIEPDFISVE